MSRACSTNAGDEERVEVIGGKAKRKATTVKPRRRWVDNKMDLEEIA
jgi:hypothetical protein